MISIDRIILEKINNKNEKLILNGKKILIQIYLAAIKHESSGMKRNMIAIINNTNASKSITFQIYLK
jgi:hypothetical protein